MDWKVVRTNNSTDYPEKTSFNNKQSQKENKKSKSYAIPKFTSQLWLLSLIVLLLCHILTPGNCFFFPKSLFRRLSSSPPSSNQHSEAQETLLGSEQRIQPAYRIQNRPTQFQDQSQPHPNPNFHVPKALCIACENFPWMPVAGPEKPTESNNGPVQAQPSQQVSKQIKQQSGSNHEPTKTIVISALGEAKGPVPLPAQQFNRKPLAIQFDSSKTQNNIAPPPQNSGGYSLINNDPDPATRPISFQIYDPPRQPTILQPAGYPPQQQISPVQGYPNEPSLFMQPPSNFAFQFQQNQQQIFRPDMRPPQIQYGKPTILQPVSSPNPQSGGYGPPPQPNVGPSFNTNIVNNNSPIPPITISTIVAAQHGKAQNTGPLPKFQGIQPGKLIYQEHTEIHGPNIAPYQNVSPVQNQRPPHNIKLPIIPKPYEGNVYQNPIQRPIGQYRHPQIQQGHQRPPQGQQDPSPGYQGPPPQGQQGPQQGYQGPSPSQQRPPQGQQGPSPGYQGPPPQGQQGPQQGYQGPPPSQQRPPQGQQGPSPGYQGPPQQGQQGPQQGYQGPPQGYQGPPPGYQGPPPQGQQRPTQVYQRPVKYLLPQPHSRPSQQGSYLPPQSQQQGSLQQQSFGNQNIINLRPPLPQQSGDISRPEIHSTNGQVFFPRPLATIQYGSPQPQSQITNQGNDPQQIGNSNSVNYRQPQSQPQTDAQGTQIHSSKIVPNALDSPSDYHQSGSNIQNQHESPSNSFIPSLPKQRELPKGIVKNPHIQSIEKLKPTEAAKQTSPVPSTQDNSWEIIPAVQTDITHLFKNPEPTQPIQQQQEVTVPVPLPVPIPILQSHSAKSPLFVVRGQDSKNRIQNIGNQGQNGNIFVQGITYHEENKNFGVPIPQPSQVSLQSQATFVTDPPPTIPYYTQAPENPRVTIGLPSLVQPQIILRPHPNQQFDPLPASISTALYHAQRTSYLTHQYLSQNGNGGNGDKTVYVHSIPVRQEFQGAPSSHVENTNYEPPSSDTNSSPDAQENQKSNSVPNPNNVADQLSVNCQNHQEWVTVAGKNQKKEENSREEQNSRGTDTILTQNSNSQGTIVTSRKPYLVYYPTPVQQSSIYWVQPPQSSPGIVKLTPQSQPPSIEEDETKESSKSLVFSPAVKEWSPKVVSQTHSVSEYRKPENGLENNDSSSISGQSQSEYDESEREAEDYSLKIPFGQKLPVRTTVTPFDIISVGGDEQPVDEARVQSLEQEEDDSNQSKYEQQHPRGQSSTSVESNQDQVSQNSQENVKDNGHNHLNEYTSGNEDLTQRPGAILRPVSTTIFHIPQSQRYATQSFRFPNFRPQQVYVHDFTKSGNGFSSIIQQQEDRTVGEQSQNVQSWHNFNTDRPKAPKIIENYPENDSEEEKQFLSSSKNENNPNKAEIASGQITAAECATAHTEPLTVTEETSPTFSTSSLADNSGKNTGSDKIRVRVGARFPAGLRPSVTSFNARATEKTTTSQPVDTNLSSSDDNDSQNPGSYSASISIPVYRPPNAREIKSHTSGSINSVKPPTNLLNLDDIYKRSELKQHSLASDDDVTRTSTEDHDLESQSVTEEGILTTMSTEKSSSYSISVDERMVEGENIEFDANKPRKVPSNSDGQKIEIRDFYDTTRDKPIQIVTSTPFLSQTELEPQSEIASTTTSTSSPANTSTKIVKTVRVRQRMRPGSGSGNFHGTIRNRFNGGGRIRVVHRPVTPEYVKHFPEFANSGSDKLGKEEEEEVKNALIELKRS